jgi:hypothetical protein
MMIDDATIDRLHSLVTEIAPELDPLYILRAEEIVGELRTMNADCLGWAVGGSSSCVFMDTLGARWRGPGNVIVLDADVIAKEARPGQFARCVQNVVIHEAAHLVPKLPDVVPLDYKPSAEFQRLVFSRLKDSMGEREPEPGGERDWHGWQFCRRAIHLWVRAAQRGYDIPIFRLFGARLGMSDAVYYLPLVLSEALRLIDATFAEIEATTPPVGLMELWQENLQWMKGRT